jgi:hypothetical protein
MTGAVELSASISPGLGLTWLAAKHTLFPASDPILEAIDELAPHAC